MRMVAFSQTVLFSSCSKSKDAELLYVCFMCFRWAGPLEKLQVAGCGHGALIIDSQNNKAQLLMATTTNTVFKTAAQQSQCSAVMGNTPDAW
jgi:hypothetical protein